MADPSKRKLHWGFRLLIAGGVLIVAGIAIFSIVTVVKRHALENRIASLRQSGEPILPSDFATLNPDAPDNSALILHKAILIVDQTKNENAWKAYDDLTPAYPLRPEEITAMQGLEKQNAAALDLIDQAKAKPRMEWKLNLASPVLLNTMLPDMSGVRALCNLLSCCAMLNHTRGNDALAIHQIQDILFVSRYADKHPSLIGHLVSIGCAALASEQIADIAPDLKIGTAPGQASPDEIRQTIDLLLDDAPPRDGFKLAMRGERMMQLDAIRSLMAGTITSAVPPGFTAIHLFMYENAIGMLDYMTALIPVIDQATWPAAKAKMPPSPKTDHFSPGTMFMQILLPSLDVAVKVDYRGKTDRRLSAIALAIRWYAVEHDGMLPMKLRDVSPKYLLETPRDPFAPSDQSISYRQPNNDPIIYSVGENGIDDSGSEGWATPPKRSRQTPPNEWETKDRVVHLTRQPRRSMKMSIQQRSQPHNPDELAMPAFTQSLVLTPSLFPDNKCTPQTSSQTASPH